LIEAVLEHHISVEHPDVATILDACDWARRATKEIYDRRFVL
jgi:hypothetical protein